MSYLHLTSGTYSLLDGHSLAWCDIKAWILQVCTAALLAQVGAWLPAERVAMSPVDAVFVRMGAKDHIMMGQSTFLVELSETAAMLNAATR